MHPDPPSDATSDSRDGSTYFLQTEGNVHPAAYDARTLTGHNRPLLIAVEQHVHQNYCQKAAKRRRTARSSAANANPNATEENHINKDYRFEYPKDLNDVCHVIITEYVAKKKPEMKSKSSWKSSQNATTGGSTVTWILS